MIGHTPYVERSPDLVRAAQLLEAANKMLPGELAERALYAMRMRPLPASENDAAIYEAALRFITAITGERQQVLP